MINKKIFFLLLLSLFLGGDSIYALENISSEKKDCSLVRMEEESYAIASERKSDVVSTAREEIEYHFPTEVPTGITENNFLDYFLLPLLLSIMIFIVFKKHIVALAKRLERAREGAKEN